MNEDLPLVSMDKVGAGVQSVRGKRVKDEKDKKEESALLSEARLRAETASISESNKDMRINRRMRHSYAKNVFYYLIFFSTFTAVIVLLSGWRIFGFELPQVVLTALVGSTAVSAISLVGIVVTGLFRGIVSPRKTKD